ncbi:hypothetical protein [Paraburkholderia graminis]|uniref:hypothetical protein n=1 Tax=Paraburkholderia graminis TaxID=60548 RepID=UPI0038B9731A
MGLRLSLALVRPKAPKAPRCGDAADEEIESIYQDTLKMVLLSTSVALFRAFDLNPAADAYRTYARYFWAAALAKLTAGHRSHWLTR